MYAYKFREKGEKDYISVIVPADTLEEANERFRNEVLNAEGWDSFDIDKRTISWAGSSIPLVRDKSSLVFIRANLDEIC